MAEGYEPNYAERSRGQWVGFQIGVSGTWERIGNVVTVQGTITHPDSSWTVAYGLPRPLNDACISLLCSDDTIKHPVYIIQRYQGDGSLQVRSGTFSESYSFAGSYICE